MSKIAIVILNWNGARLLEAYLPFVLQHSKGSAVYVADNASTDDSIAVLQTQFPDITIIHNTENGGFAKGYNDALQKVEAEIFCLLNSDVEVTPNWLTPIQEAFDTMSNMAVAQPKILDLNKRDYFEYAGAAGGYIDRLGYPFCRGRIFQALEKDIGQYNDVHEIFWATGACMFVRQSVFTQLKGFDEDYFAHQEEVDFCWRAKNKGYQVYYIGASEVYHLGGSTLSNMNPKKTFLNFRNSLFSITKNLPRRKAFLVIIMRLFLDAIAGIRFIFQFKLNHCFAIIHAHFSFYRHFMKMFRKREKANFILNYYATKSIVWSHFVHQVKKFNILVKD